MPVNLYAGQKPEGTEDCPITAHRKTDLCRNLFTVTDTRELLTTDSKSRGRITDKEIQGVEANYHPSE